MTHGWTDNAIDLADKLLDLMVVRQDVHGWYESGGSITKHERPTIDILVDHCLGAATIGLHTTNLQDQCKWIAWDIDAHGKPGDDAQRNKTQALQLCQILIDVGLTPHLFDSNGAGGYHVICFFEDMVGAADCYGFARWARAQVPDLDCETFPKQPSVLRTAKQIGNYLRVPGRHHKRNHWTKAWGGSGWLDDNGTAVYILSIEPDEVDVVQDERHRIDYQPPAPAAPAGPLDEDIAKNCLTQLSQDRVDDYNSWICAGMICKSISDDLFNPWHDWSQGSGEYKDQDECQSKWDSFGEQSKDVSVLEGWCYQDGGLPWSCFQDFTWNIRPGQPIPTAVMPKGKAIVEVLKPDARTVIGNHTIRWDEDDKGKPKAVKEHVRLPDIVKDIEKAYQWPRVINGMLFVPGKKHKLAQADSIDLLNDHAQLMSWLQGKGRVRWATGMAWAEEVQELVTLVNQRELYPGMAWGCQKRYQGIEYLPHHPARPSTYYVESPAITAALRSIERNKAHTGALAEILDNLNAQTSLDESALLAYLLTPGWGGAPGMRPGLGIMSDHRQGAGKTQTAYVISDLWGGHTEVAAKHDINWAEVYSRLMDDLALSKRIVLIDNVTGRMRASELDSLITSNTINAKRMYKGDFQRPNNLTVVLTFNSPQLSTDLAQRVNIVKIGPQKHNTDFVGWRQWFMGERRAEAIADCIHILRGPNRCEIERRNMDRWASWQKAVLQKVEGGNEVARMFKERRDEVDFGADDAAEVKEAIRIAIKASGLESDRVVRFHVPDMVKIIDEANIMSGSATSKSVGSMLRGLNLRELRPGRASDRRFWIWEPDDWNAEKKSTWYNPR